MKFKPYWLLLILSACQSGNTAYLDNLPKAGANRSELEKVLAHYSQHSTDALKLKAAIFLISNMDNKYYFKGDSLNQFLQLCDSISNCPVTPTAYKQVFIAYNAKNGSLVGDPARVPDLQSISAAYLIQNIDEAFSRWNAAGWKDKVTFDDFCEYILPYRIGNESYEQFRSLLYNKYAFSNIDNCTMQMAADSILSRTNKKGMYLTQFPDLVPYFPISVLQGLKGGSCVESSGLAIYIMRSFGLPVAQDFTPHWPHRANGHAWGALIISQDSSIDFEGVNAPKVGGHLLINTGNKVAKVYRRTYSKQPGSLAMIHDKEAIPDIFQDPCIKDVSSSYYKGAEVSIEYNKDLAGDKRFAYLCVFDDRHWAPVSWTTLRHGQVLFTGMGRNIVYLPAIYDEGEYKAIATPFKIDSFGTVQPVSPDLTAPTTLYLKRKYPIFDWWDSRTLAMKGGRFQASNKADFSDAITVYTISSAPEMNYQTINISPFPKYSYWRYLPPDSTYGDIAEIQFYDEHNHQLTGHPIGSPESDPENGVHAAFDNDPLTFFQGLTANNNWVGMHFDTPQKIARIKFLCRNDDNFINQSDKYELFYWDKEEWQSVGVHTGDSSQVLVFHNVPAHALYLLHDRTRGKEERIFTYEQDKQVWW